ncbi:MAG TPA: S53 family peptidase [Solirubrobacteraceae bacterium]|nr:S53 family peptidase [Solirubrobacteraceae bacterium]
MLIPTRIVCGLVATGALSAASPALASAVAPPAPPSIQLAGSAPSATSAAATGGLLSPSSSLTFQVWLTPDIAGATAFADSVATPGSADYHQYLTPAQYTAQYGPSAAEAQAVSAWLGSAGFTNVQVASGRDSVTATGSAAQVDSTFSVQMGDYRADSGTATFAANDRDLSIPASVSADVMSVTGLDGAPAATFHTAPRATGGRPGSCSQYWGQQTTTSVPLFAGVHRAAVAVCGYSAEQLRGAYGMTSADTGTGETIALIEDGTPRDMFQTLTDYAAANGLPAPAPAQFQEDQLGDDSGCENAFGVEEQLDSEAAYAMAPGANQLMIDGDSCDQALEGIQPLFDALDEVLGGDGSAPMASIVSNSWGLMGGEQDPPVYAQTAHAIDLRAAAEGVGMYFAAGDNPGIAVPASDPYSIAVGGTTLGIGASGNRVFETGWSDQVGFLEHGSWVDDGIPRAASGGGVSTLYAQPSYQAGVVPASMATYNGQLDRTVPDLSADADRDSGILEGVIAGGGRYNTFDLGGTSLACPLVAGMVADAQQGQAAPFGFIDPLLYSLAGTDAFDDVLPLHSSAPAIDRAAVAPESTSGWGHPASEAFDAQIPGDTSQVTARGYDTMTGLGTPNGTAFIDALRSGS